VRYCPKITTHKEAGLAERSAEYVTIEKGLGPEGRIAVVRFDRGDGINALSPEALRQLTDAARSFEDDCDTSAVVLTGSAKAFSAGFDLKDAEGRSRRTMDVGSLRRHLKLGPRLSRAWQEMEQITHRRHRRILHRWRRSAGGGAGFSHHEPNRPYAGAGNRARHEHELAERSAYAASDRPSPHQTGGHPGRPADQRQ
jgi:hypothetical protein